MAKKPNREEIQRATFEVSLAYLMARVRRLPRDRQQQLIDEWSKIVEDKLQELRRQDRSPGS